MLDRDELDRRRFARLLGIDGAAGFGLPISGDAETDDARERDADGAREG